MNTNKNPLIWILVIGLLIVLVGAAVAIVLTVQKTSDTAMEAIQPVRDLTNDLGTQVANILHPTPTIIPDPVTIINQIRPLARLETIQYTIEKVITAEVGQTALRSLFGDRLLFVGHGYVIAGVDLSKIRSEDLVFEDGMLIVNLPEPEIFVATLDNNQSYVYDRDTGLLTHGDINLETTARQAAEEQIRKAALEDGILEKAKENTETFLGSLLESLGHSRVSFVWPE
jgi:Protein of unknown function (DUF4230)